MKFDLFYYNQLSQTQKKIYAHQLKHFLDEHLGLPYAIPIKVSKPQELLQVYNALFLDNTSSLLPAMNTIAAYRDGDKCVLTSELEPCSINEDKEVKEILDVLRGKINNYSNSIFDKVTYATRLLSERTCYYLKNNGEGENPYSVLLKHSGYCTGIARTTRALLSNDIVCVRGYLKKEFSIVKAKEGEKGVPHIWNALFYNGEWIFFDACQSILTANNTVVATELDREFYRRNYLPCGRYEPPKFTTLNQIKAKYILEDEKLWSKKFFQ